MKLENLIKKYKKENGASSKFIAQKLGVSNVTLNKWSKEDVNKRSLKVACQISELFNIKLSDMVRG